MDDRCGGFANAKIDRARPVQPGNSQNALPAILAAALDVLYLPAQGPQLYALDDSDHLQAALGEGVLALQGKGLAVHLLFHQPLPLQFLEPNG